MAIVLPKFPRRRASVARPGENRPIVTLNCCRPDGRYAPGDVLACTWQLNRLTADQVQGVEVSVLWYTEGKGDEDLAVHYFRRWSAARLAELDLSAPQQFMSELPASPLSYHGHLVRIRWCLRLRLFLTDAADIVTEFPLTLQPHVLLADTVLPQSAPGQIANATDAG